MLRKVFERLFGHYGPQRWWPGDSALEVAVGAVLTQNTSWKNVEHAIESLRGADLLALNRLNRVSTEELQHHIRPAGYYRVKARRLKNLVTFIVQTYGDLETMFSADMHEVRNGLLSVNGVGPETADAILLYAGGHPTFVVDAYAARILVRHEWIDPKADYQQIKQFFERRLEPDAPLFNEFHALIVAVGKDHCKSKPLCAGCPLEPMLPQNGPCQQ